MTLQTIFTKQQTFFRSGKTWPLAFRQASLRRLRRALQNQEAVLLAALRQDLGKSALEAYTSELGLVLCEIDLALRQLRRWAKPQPQPTAWLNWPAKSYRLPEPRGVVLIIGPWNYPLQLILLPLVGALAAGNCVVLKPSEFAPATAQAIAQLIAGVFPPSECHVALGDARETAAYLELPWDHIFFTGSTRVGRLVMQAAAQHPASVTLELGGKNPCIVMADSPLSLAAERIAWGKFLNAGQTCGAPDHCYVPRNQLNALAEALTAVIRRFYGSDPRTSPDYGRIINDAHWRRLTGYLTQGRILTGGGFDATTRYLAPTVLADIPEGASILHEEIFGPVLPLLPFDDFDALLEKLRTRPKPLAVYLFTRDRGLQTKTLRGLPAGTMAINDTLSQIATSRLPLGGVGASGQGSYHGAASFACFSHYKSVLSKGFAWNNRLKNPPNTISLALLKKVYPWLV